MSLYWNVPWMLLCNWWWHTDYGFTCSLCMSNGWLYNTVFLDKCSMRLVSLRVYELIIEVSWKFSFVSIVIVMIEPGHTLAHVTAAVMTTPLLVKQVIQTWNEKKIKVLVYKPLSEGNPLVKVTGGFSFQRGSNAESVSMSWCHHVMFLNLGQCASNMHVLMLCPLTDCIDYEFCQNVICAFTSSNFIGWWYIGDIRDIIST